MVALSILFSYGLQFCVPSEIVWTRLEPWLRRRRQSALNAAASNGKPAVISTITSAATAAANLSMTGAGTVDEKKQLELELGLLEEPMNGAYYVMRGSMILGTGIFAYSSRLVTCEPGGMFSKEYILYSY